MAILINGDGNPAVYAAQDADMLSGAFTNDKTVILDVGEKFRADVLSSSVIEVHDGVILTKEGRRIQLDQNAVDLFEIPAGEQGETSYYWIGYKLEIDEDSHQICNTFVQKMDNAADTIPEGSFREGDTEVYISLYHVVQDTLGVLTPTIGIDDVMTMIDLLDYVGSKISLPDQTKSITQNIGQIDSDLSDLEKYNLEDTATLVSAVEYTCPSDGYVNLKLNYDVSPNNKLAFIRVNGIVMLQVNPSEFNGEYFSVFVKKNSIVRFSLQNIYASDAECKFYSLT